MFVVVLHLRAAAAVGIALRLWLTALSTPLVGGRWHSILGCLLALSGRFLLFLLLFVEAADAVLPQNVAKGLLLHTALVVVKRQLVGLGPVAVQRHHLKHPLGAQVTTFSGWFFTVEYDISRFSTSVLKW